MSIKRQKLLRDAEISDVLICIFSLIHSDKHHNTESPSIFNQINFNEVVLSLGEDKTDETFWSKLILLTYYIIYQLLLFWVDHLLFWHILGNVGLAAVESVPSRAGRSLPSQGSRLNCLDYFTLRFTKISLLNISFSMFLATPIHNMLKQFNFAKSFIS